MGRQRPREKAAAMLSTLTTSAEAWCRSAVKTSSKASLVDADAVEIDERRSGRVETNE